MRAALLAIAVLFCLAAAPPTTEEADDRPISLSEAKARGSIQSIKDLAGLPVINVDSIDKILKLSLKEKELILQTTIAPTEQSLVRIPNFPGISTVKLLGVVEPGSPMIIVQYDFENRDYTVPNVICRYTSVSMVAGSISLWQAVETLDDQAHTVELKQNLPTDGEDNPHVSLFVQIEAEKVNLKLSAENVIELRRKYPGEVARYVDPIFQVLRQEALLARVNSKLASQVFAASFVPPLALVEQVNKLVKDLNADSFQTREAASRQLETLGQSAALLLMHLPRKGLSDEQTSRIDAFLATYKPASDDEAAKLRADKNFLLDCLASDDLAIRAAALDALRHVTGKPIEFNLNADPATRESAVAALRDQYGSPTTRQFKE